VDMNDEKRRADPCPAAAVVGGGIGGLAAARALQLAGWSVQALEKAERLNPLGAGISLWPNAVRALTVLDVPLPARGDHGGAPNDSRRAAAGGGGTAGGGVRTSRGRWLSRTDPWTYPARYGAALVAVHRADLQQALLECLAPDTVQTGTEVSHVEQHPDGVLVRHSRGVVSADLVVLTDGLASSTRHLVAGPRPRSRFAGYTAWRGVTTPAAGLPASGAATESWGRGQRFGIVPLTDGRLYWFATANTAEGEQARDSEHAEVLRRFAGWHPPVLEVVQATDHASVLRHDVYDLRPDPARYVQGRLVLLGDAAHAMTPNLGQGACQALEDAATLMVLLRSGAAMDTALTAYDAVRRPRAQSIARRSRQIGRLGQLQAPGLTLARDLLLRATPARLTDRELDTTLTWAPPDGPSC